MPLLQGQPFRLIKPPDHVEAGDELFVIQHTGEKFVSKSDYEDRLALYSQSIWTCQCTGKSGLTHQEAWTSEAKVRVLLNSSFPAPLVKPILQMIHHSTLPLDQLVEATSNHCYSRFHVGEELTLLGPQPVQVRVTAAKEVPMAVKTENGATEEAPATPKVVNGCTPSESENSLANGTGNGVTEGEETSPSGKGKEEGSGKKKLLPLLYDVSVIGEDRAITDVLPKDLQRTYKVPPKEHFRLFIRANSSRQRSSSYTPWNVTDELVKQYNIQSKLASIFTQPRTGNKKRKLEGQGEDPVKKTKSEKADDSEKKPKVKAESKAKKVKRDPDAPRRKPGPKPGSKRTPKVESPVKPSPNLQTPVKLELSDSEDDVSLAVLASRSPKMKNGNSESPKSNSTPEQKTPPAVTSPVKSEKRGNSGEGKENSKKMKMKQATLFDMKTPKKISDKSPGSKATPKRSPQKREITPESVMRLPVMKKMMSNYKRYKGVQGGGRKLVYTMDQVLKKLSARQIEVIPDEAVRTDLIKRHERLIEKRILTKMSPEEREEYLKQKAREVAEKRIQSKREEKRKIEDKTLINAMPLPQPKLVSTPEEIPNSLFGDIAMIVEFVECYKEILILDTKINISCEKLLQALSQGTNGYKYIADVMSILLHVIIDDERYGDTKELGVKISELTVHYHTAIELARLCLGKKETSDATSQHSDEGCGEEENELSDGLLEKMESSELHEFLPEEIIMILKALCHHAMASFASLEYVEEIEDKVYSLYKERAQIKKQTQKEEMEKKQQKKEERLQKKMDKSNLTKKSPGRPKGYSPKKKAVTLDNFYGKKEKEEDQPGPDIISRVKNRRQLAEVEKKEREIQKQQEQERLLREEEERKRETVVLEYDRVSNLKECLIRLQPLGVDRNHDRYWIFKTMPGLFIEKGWVDPNTTYCTKKLPPKSPSKVLTTPSKTVKVKESDSDSDDKPLSTIKQELASSPQKVSSEGHQGDHQQGRAEQIKSTDLNDNRPPAEQGSSAESAPDTSLLLKSPGLMFTASPSRAPARGTGRPRGRPKKIKPCDIEGVSSPVSTPVSTPSPGRGTGRPRGRPRLNKPTGFNANSPTHMQVSNPSNRGRPKLVKPPDDDDADTFPSVGQNLWFHYESMEDVDKLVESLAEKGAREGPLKAAILNQRALLEERIKKEKEEPLDEVAEDGAKQLMESLREDIIQIEGELTEGCLGSVPDFDEWEKKAQEASTVQELAECLVQVQQHIQFKYLKGNMAPVKKHIFVENPEMPQEFEEMEGKGARRWREAVTNSQTLARLHLLVSMFDSCIKWEKSIATKKCKICRHQDSSIPLAICDQCEGSYHWSCMRPQLREAPPEPWLCPACKPKKSNRVQRQISQGNVKQTEEEPEVTLEIKQEKICRVCERGLGLIFCCKCPAAYHSECHDPPLLTRARKDWECVDCKTGVTKQKTRSGRSVSSRTPFQATTESEVVKDSRNRSRGGDKSKKGSSRSGGSGSRQSLRRSARTQYAESDEEEEEEEEDNDDDDFSYRSRSRKKRSDRSSSSNRRTSRRNTSTKKNYKIDSEEEEEEVEEEEEEVEEEEDYEVSNCVYCGLGPSKRGNPGELVPCMTCDSAFHHKCARKHGLAASLENMSSYQCSKCLRNGRSPSKSPMKKAKNADEKEKENEEEEEEENNVGAEEEEEDNEGAEEEEDNEGAEEEEEDIEGAEEEEEDNEGAEDEEDNEAVDEAEEEDEEKGAREDEEDEDDEEVEEEEGENEEEDEEMESEDE